MRIALVLAVLLGAAGCKKTLHWKAIEDELAAGTHLDATCPETPVHAGLVFRCQLSSHGQVQHEVEIKLLDTAGHIASREVH
jgi:hypothetical protein